MNSSTTYRLSNFDNTLSSRLSNRADVSTSSCNYDTHSVTELKKMDKQILTSPKALREKNETLVFTSADLSDDLRLITEIPDMCEVKFVIGQSREAVFGIKAVLAMRCRYFYDLIMSEEHKCRDKKKKIKNTGSLSLRLGLFRKRISERKTSHLVIELNGVDVNIFRAVIRYLHSGKIKLTRSNSISVFLAAEKFGLNELKMVCEELVQELITMKTVLSLLNTLEDHYTSPSLDNIMEKVLAFTMNAQNLLRSAHFEHLNKFAAHKILTRETLLVSDEIRWDATLRWSRRHCKGKSLNIFKETVRPYLSKIDFGEISLRKLTWQIEPMGILADEIIKTAISQHNQPRDVHDCQKAELAIIDSCVANLKSEVNKYLSCESRDLNKSDCRKTETKMSDVDVTEGSYSEESFYFNENDLLDELLEEESRLSSLFDVSVSSSETSQ